MIQITTMEEIIIANITTQSFFRYTKTTETDVQYNKILVELLQPIGQSKIKLYFVQHICATTLKEIAMNYLFKIMSLILLLVF